MIQILKAVAAAGLLLVASCATASFSSKHSNENARGASPAPSSTFYSFVDARSSDLGTQMVAQVNEQLIARLNERGVASRMVTYGDTTDKPAVGTVSIAVEEIIASRLGEEVEFGADFRLIIMPSQMNIYGATQSYEVAWELIDIRTGETVWSTTLSGNRTVWYRQDEDAEGRARTVVDGVIEEMAASGLFNPHSDFAI